MKRRETGSRGTRVLRGVIQPEIRRFFPLTRAVAAAASTTEDAATASTTVHECRPRDLEWRGGLGEPCELCETLERYEVVGLCKWGGILLHTNLPLEAPRPTETL